jgi:hypothetical protein
VPIVTQLSKPIECARCKHECKLQSVGVNNVSVLVHQL